MDARWKEYPLTRGGDIVLSLSKVQVGVGTGFASCLAMCIGIGLPAELGLVEPLLVRMGASPEQAAQILAEGDGPLRLVALVSIVLIVLTMLGAGVWSVLADIAVTAGLLAAAESRASRSQVPTPQQVGRVDRRSIPGVDGMVIVLIIMSALAAAALLGGGLAMRFAEAMVAGALAIVLAAALYGLFRILRRVRRRLLAQRERIAAHWTTDDERGVWDVARSRSDADGTSATSRRRRARRHPCSRAGRVLGNLAFLCLVALPLVLTLTVGQFFPDLHRFGGWHTGSATTPSGPAGTVAWGSLVALTGLLFAMGLLPVAASLLEWVGMRAERRLVDRALEDPGAPAPSDAVVIAHRERGLPRSGMLFGQLAGMGSVPSLAVLLLAASAPDAGTRVEHIVAELVVPAGAVLAASALLLVAAFVITAADGRDGLDRRNRLWARWPVLPRPETETRDDQRVMIRATVGPALTPPADDDPDDMPASEGGG